MSSPTIRVSLAQINSTADPAANLAVIRTRAEEARAAGARLVVFPEATMCAFGNPLKPVAEPLDGPWATAVRDMARELDIVIMVGMFTPGTDGRVRNTALVTGPGVEAAYDKIHLFDAFGFAESDTVEPGDRPVTFTLDGVTFGLAICYDIRFPALFTANAAAGADVNIVCASWGAGEGKADQWTLLARARALDSTSFVLAVDQADPAAAGGEVRSKAPLGVGHSLAVSPLGVPLAELGAEPGLLTVDLDLDQVAQVRSHLPVLANAKPVPAPGATTAAAGA